MARWWPSSGFNSWRPGAEVDGGAAEDAAAGCGPACRRRDRRRCGRGGGGSGEEAVRQTQGQIGARQLGKPPVCSGDEEERRGGQLPPRAPATNLGTMQAAIPLVLYSVAQKLTTPKCLGGLLFKSFLDWLPMMAALLAFVLMSKYQKAQASKVTSVVVGEKAPDFTLEFMDKSAKSLMELIQGTKLPTVVDGLGAVEYEKKKVTCWNCGKVGHYGRDCRQPRKGGDAGAGGKGGGKGGKAARGGKGARGIKGGASKCVPSASSAGSAIARKVGANGKDAAQVKCSVCGKQGLCAKDCWSVFRESSRTAAALVKALELEAAKRPKAAQSGPWP